MAKEKAILNDVKVDEIVLINGLKYKFKGFEKRRTNLGKQEMFIFNCVEEKLPEGATKERKFERWTFKNTQIVKLKENLYEWH